MLIRNFITIVLALFICEISKGQDVDQPSLKFSKAQLTEDVDYLREMLIKCHPGLFWHSTEAEFEKAIAALRASLTNEMTELEFLAEVAKLNSVIKCVHSDIRPSAAFNNYWKDSVLLIPINIEKVGSDFFIHQNLSDNSALKYGTKIIAINDDPIETIVEQLLPYIPADGDNQTRKFDALKRGFYRYFSYYINSKSDEFKITIENNDEKHSDINIKGLTKAEYDHTRKTMQIDLLPVEFKMLDPLTAVLTIRSFRSDLMEKHQIVFKDYIQECFEKLKKQNNQYLIIDLRGNGGGYSEYAAELYSYLTNTAFRYCKRQTVTTDHLIEGVEYDIPKTFAGFPEGIIKENGEFIWSNHSVLSWRQPAENHFNGKVYFLIDGGGSSTTSELASLAKSNNIGTFVGEEVGGTYVGNSGGILGWIELPNTKLRVRIAMVKYEIAGNEKSARNGVLPDLEIEYTIKEMLEGTDLEMRAVLQEIAERHSK